MLDSFQISSDNYLLILSSKDNLVDEDWVPIKGVIFDMDGTLTKPVLNFSEMRQRVGVPPSQDILQYVNSLTGEDRVKAMTVIEEIEEDAINKVELQPGVIELLHFLAENKVHTQTYLSLSFVFIS